MRIPSVLLVLSYLVALGAHAQLPAQPMPLWPGTPPGVPNLPANEQEHDTTTAKDNLVAGKPVIRTGFVRTPTLAFYPAPVGENTGAVVIVFPGGGYRILAYDLEGMEICAALNGSGVNCIVVKYRVPDAGPFPRYMQDLADAQRAVRLVRQHAAEWQLDPKRVGVMGFSAGGHLVAVLGAHYEEAIYPAADAADKFSARPDFTLLIYPGYLSVDETDEIRPEVRPPAQTPPSFLLQTEDDPVRVENAWAYYRALKQAKIPAEMHLYANGGHGYGARPTKLPATHWLELAAIWMRTIGVTTP